MSDKVPIKSVGNLLENSSPLRVTSGHCPEENQVSKVSVSCNDLESGAVGETTYLAPLGANVACNPLSIFSKDSPSDINLPTDPRIFLSSTKTEISMFGFSSTLYQAGILIPHAICLEIGQSCIIVSQSNICFLNLLGEKTTLSFLTAAITGFFSSSTFINQFKITIGSKTRLHL